MGSKDRQHSGRKGATPSPPGSAVKAVIKSGGANKVGSKSKSVVDVIVATEAWAVIKTVETSPTAVARDGHGAAGQAASPESPQSPPLQNSVGTPASLLKSCLKKSINRSEKRRCRSRSTGGSISFSPKLVTGSGLTYSAADYDRTYCMPTILSCDWCGLYFRGICHSCPKCPEGACDICDSCFTKEKKSVKFCAHKRANFTRVDTDADDDEEGEAETDDSQSDN